MNVNNPGEYELVSATACQEPKPTWLSKPCFAMVCPAEWIPSPWGKVNENVKVNVN